VNAVQISQSVTSEQGYPLAESGTSEVLQRRVAVLLRDEEQSSTVPGKYIELGTASHPARRSRVCAQDLILKFADNELTLVSPYTPNVTASIVTVSDPQEIFVLSETCPVHLIYPTGFDFAVPALMRVPKSIERLRSAYAISDLAKVGSFIEENRLTEALVQAIEPIKKAFGESPSRKLAVLEDDEGSRNLFCLVAFPGSLNEAQEALDSFDRDWWLRNAGKFGSKLNFDFELV
jgi:hypothetical protein